MRRSSNLRHLKNNRQPLNVLSYSFDELFVTRESCRYIQLITFMLKNTLIPPSVKN